MIGNQPGADPDINLVLTLYFYTHGRHMIGHQPGAHPVFYTHERHMIGHQPGADPDINLVLTLYFYTHERHMIGHQPGADPDINLVLTLYFYIHGRHMIGYQPAAHSVLLYTRKEHDRTSTWCSPCFVTHEEGTESMIEYPKEDRNESFNKVLLKLIRMFNRHIQSRAYFVSQLLHRLSQE